MHAALLLAVLGGAALAAPQQQQHEPRFNQPGVPSSWSSTKEKRFNQPTFTWPETGAKRNEKRFNQPGVPVSLPLTPLSRRANHPDPAVRHAFARDDFISTRLKYARAMPEESHDLLRRDRAFVEDSIRRRDLVEIRKRQNGPGPLDPVASASVSSSGNAPGKNATGGSEASGNSSSAVPLTDYNFDQGYACTVSVGNPPQDFLVVADTGSQDFVLFDQTCTGCRGHPGFDSSASKTFQETETTMYEAYGTGEAAGMWALDRVEMGGYYVDSQPIALVTSGTVAKYMGSELSGIMGLGVPYLSLLGPNGPAIEAPPMFWMTVAKGVWTDKQFGVYLERLNTDPSAYVLSQSLEETHQANSGVLTLGGLDNTLYTGDIHYMDANTTIWWQLPLDGFTVNGKKYNARQAPTVIDTGSTAIMMPRDAVNAFHSSIKGANVLRDASGDVWYMPCDTSATASFTFGGVEYSVQSVDIMRGLIPGMPNMCMSNIGEGPWLLGAAFMKNVYTAFRIEPAQIGFAQLATSAINNGKTGSTSNTINQEAKKDSSAAATNRPSVLAIAFGAVAAAALL